jgi:hypothetical protein
MSLEVLHSPHSAARTVAYALGLNSWPCPENRFEILRATVWSLSASHGKTHINRIVSAALTTWRFLSDQTIVSEEILRTELRRALSILQDAGDLVEFGGGYWAPATARFVELPDRGGYLLIGGVPSALLRADFGWLEFHGPHRHIANLPSELNTLIPVESFESWTKLPSESLEDWAFELIQSLERQPYSPASAEVFEFYLPNKSRRGVPQFKRWSDDPGDTSNTLLARRKRLYGTREYRLVEIRAGRIVSICDLQDIDVRRFMYALDLACGNSVRAKCLRITQPSEWVFTSELPRSEQRAFAAFGSLSIPDARPFERRWTFVRNEDLVLSMLLSLGIMLEK